MKDPQDGVANAAMRTPGPRTLADFIPADSGITIDDEDDAWKRCHDAVMEQEQQEIEKALLDDDSRSDHSAGDVEHDHYQNELFDGFVHYSPAEDSHDRAMAMRSGGPVARSPTQKSWTRSPRKHDQPSRGSSSSNWRLNHSARDRSRWNWSNSSSLTKNRRAAEHFDRWSENRRKAHRRDSQQSITRHGTAKGEPGPSMAGSKPSSSKAPSPTSKGRDLQHPDAPPSVPNGAKPMEDALALIPDTHKTRDPVDTVLSIMDAASDAVEWVGKHWDLSEQELNAHCEAKAEEAQRLFEKAFFTAQLDQDDHALVLKGTEGHMARDVVAPKSYEQALKGRFASLWQDSIRAELENLRQHKVYTWCRRAPGMRVIGSPITAFKIKVDKNGRISQFKTRVCARGYLQIKGRDFYASFAPVSVITTFRAMIASASRKGMWIDSVDVRSAFLLAPLRAPLYCEPPKGAEKPFEGALWKLERCLYGLKQSAAQWHTMLSSTLQRLGFVQGVADPCYFSRSANGGYELRLCIHVDDICICCNDRAYLTAFRKRLAEEFTLTSSTTDRSCQYLGMTVARLHDGAVQLSLNGYTADLLHQYKMQDAKPVNTPMQPGVNLLKDQCPKTDAERLEMSTTPYLQAIGSLLWLAQTCRPDIAIAVNILSRFASNPGKLHWAGVKWLLRYLAGTAKLGIVYGRKVDGIPHSPLTASCDASWADCKETRVSTSGYVIMSCGGPISWSSRKMKVQALSSMEAEFHALCLCTRELVHLRTLFIRDFRFSPKDLTIPAYGKLALEAYTGDHPPPEPIAIMEDNTAAIALAKSSGARHSRSKHIELKWFWVRSMVQSGVVLPVYCPTKENISDLMTKPVSRPVLEYLRPRILWPHEEPQSQDSIQPIDRSGASS